jgi:hypothetical protein
MVIWQFAGKMKTCAVLVLGIAHASLGKMKNRSFYWWALLMQHWGRSYLEIE